SAAAGAAAAAPAEAAAVPPHRAKKAQEMLGLGLHHPPPQRVGFKMVAGRGLAVQTAGPLELGAIPDDALAGFQARAPRTRPGDVCAAGVAQQPATGDDVARPQPGAERRLSLNRQCITPCSHRVRDATQYNRNGLKAKPAVQ